MVKVMFGGVFLYSKNAEALAQWYAGSFGFTLDRDPDAGAFYYQFEQRAREDPSRIEKITWAVLPREEEAPSGVRTVMLNFRVDDLESCLTGLQERGIVIEKRQDYPYGRFAWVSDPDGNPVEIYEESP